MICLWPRLLFLILGSLAINIKKECMPEDEVIVLWEGSEIDMTFWLSEDDYNKSSALKDDSEAPIYFNLEFMDRSRTDDFDRILLYSSDAKIKRWRNRKLKVTSVNITQSLEVGWNVLKFVSRAGIQICNGNKTIFSERLDNINIKRLEVRGSYVAVNCHQDPLIWPVEGRQEVHIPFLASETNKFILYSNVDTKPTIAFGPSKKLQLGWDRNHLVDQILYKKEVQKPIPPFKDHIIIVSCTQIGKVTCQILDGYNRSIQTWTFENSPSNFSIYVESREKLYVSYKIPKYSDGAYRQNLAVVPVEKEENMESENSKSITGSENSNSITGWIAFTAILGILLLAAVGYIIYDKSKERSKKSIPTSDVEQHPMIPKESAVVHSNTSMVQAAEDFHSNNEERRPTNKDDEFMRAIKTNKISYVKELLERTKVHYSHKLKAHYLGRKEILQAIREKEGKDVEVPSNDIIKEVYNALEDAINDVFAAAEKGDFEGTHGARIKLEDYGLPGTIMDQNGSSILHHMVMFNGPRPIWNKRDIKNFLKLGDYYINAVDHNGDTVLHVLASMSSDNIQVDWDGKLHYSNNVKLELADLLIQNGAHPNKKNLDNKDATTIAKERGQRKLVELLEKATKDFEAKQSNAKPVDDFDNLLDASRQGDNGKISYLLKNGTKLLPMSASKDPLVEAIQNNRRDTVFLLLGAGAPICNRCIDDLTPLDAAHKTLELPACYAAIMRKTFHDRLENEKRQLPSDQSELSQIIDNHIQNIKEEGKEAEGIKPKDERDKDNEEYSKSVRELLVTAANHKLSLTCLLLGQRDVFLHIRPSEENPLSKAILNRHIETQIALCRDLGVTPFTCDKNENLESSALHTEMYNKEISILVKALEKKYENPEIDKAIIKKLGCYENVLDTQEQLPIELFYILAKYDLVVTLDKILKYINFKINEIVEEFSGSTMMHIAAMHGNIRVIEYLVYKGANWEMKTIGNFTAAHLAAISGHKECFHYIQDWMKKENMHVLEAKCNLGLTASQVMAKYENLCERCNNPLMSHDDALVVKNESKVNEKAHEILYRKGKVNGIKNFKDLEIFCLENACDEKDMKKTQQSVKTVTENLKNDYDQFVKGEFVSIGPLAEGNEILDITHVDFRYDMEDKVNKVDAIKMITDTFPRCVEVAMKNFKDKNQEYSLAPPFLTRVGKGVQIRWAYHKEDSLKLLTSYIVPTVILADNGKKYYYNKTDLELSTHDADQMHFSKLPETEKKAWLMCRMLRKLTLPCWWSPTFKTQYYKKDWHTWSLGVTGLSETKSKKNFKDKKTTQDPYERILKTYENIAEKNKDDKWACKSSTNEENLSVCGILQYLSYLKSEEKKGLNVDLHSILNATGKASNSNHF